MMKKFFIAMLGSMAAFWLSIGILVIGSFFIIGVLVAKTSAGDLAGLSGDKILYLDLKGMITETEQTITLSDYLNSGTINTDNLSNIIQSIRLAKEDKDVKGIYIDCNGSELGIASRTELMEAIADFKTKGKWVYAYADNFTQGDYLVATAADKIYLNPVGAIDIHGLGGTVMFYKDLLEKVGIGINVVKVGTFKSAVEPYIRMDMSPENRLQTQQYIDQMWGVVTGAIAKNRSVNIDAVKVWADSLAFTWAPEKYVEQKAVTKLCYRAEVEDMLRTEMDVKKDDPLPFITPNDYVKLKADKLASSSKKHIAVLYAEGDIVDTGKGGISAEEIVPLIRELADNDEVKGLILRVNSPGGSAFASEQIWNALEYFKSKKKPFYVSMSDYAASGGYYISCGADKIFADEATLTGSIGIFGILPNAEKLIKDKIGIGIETVATGPNATFLNLMNAPTDQQLAGMQEYVNRGYDTFTKRVAAGRKMTQAAVDSIGQGRVWTGLEARRIGLVDELGSMYTALKAMAKTLDIDEDKYVFYPETSKDFMTILLSSMQNDLKLDTPGLSEAEKAEIRKTLLELRYISPLQSRMDPLIIR